MQEKDLYRMINGNDGTLVSSSFSALMRKVYVWMTLALVITGVTAYGVANSPALLTAIFSSRALMWGLIIGELALVFVISGMINRLSLTTATLLFVLYSVLNGATLSVIFVVFSTSAIAKTFFITAGMFGAMSLYGYTTKQDLSSIGKILFMALIGIIIATIVNVFMKSSMVDTVISYIGVVVFTGLTAWDTQKIKNALATAEGMDEGVQKIALIGALNLYLDFINLFLYLLRIFGDRR